MSPTDRSCDVLVLSPHPDDADLFCGATLAAWAAAGQRVRVVDLSAGELGSNGSVEERRGESLRAARELGIDSERPVMGFPDGGIDHQNPDQRAALVSLLRESRPALLVAPWREDRHPDHRQASLLARDAFFWSGVTNYAPEFSPALRPQRLLYYPCNEAAPVNCFVDVSESMDAFGRAVECYSSQVRRSESSRATFLNRPEFTEGLRARRRIWGEQSGVAHAEAFVCESPLALEAGALLPARSEESGS